MKTASTAAPQPRLPTSTPLAAGPARGGQHVESISTIDPSRLVDTHKIIRHILPRKNNKETHLQNKASQFRSARISAKSLGDITSIQAKVVARTTWYLFQGDPYIYIYVCVYIL